MAKLSLYIVQGHCSAEVENGASRRTVAPTVPQMLAAMPEDDRRVLETFCRTVLDARPVVTVNTLAGGLSCRGK